MLCKTEGFACQERFLLSSSLAGVLPVCVTPVSGWKRSCSVIKAIENKQGELYLKHGSVVWLFALFHSLLVSEFYPSVALFVTCHMTGATRASAE